METVVKLPARKCDQQAIDWLAKKTNGELNFWRVHREIRSLREQHPRATIRVDRLWSMSERSHDLWVTTARLMLCFSPWLCDCIKPKRSAADDDWENIIAYAKKTIPFRFTLDDWRDAKSYREKELQWVRSTR